jgi:SOUL heme-binding protein
MALILLGCVSAIAAASYAGFILYVAQIEQPEYRSIKQAGPFELREYPPLVVAEVARAGDRRTAVRQGFRALAAYIFAKERSGEAIAMTAPVTQQRREIISMTAPVTQTPTPDDAWTIRFVMPSKYRIDTLPAPQNADIRLIAVPARLRAAVRFSGVATDNLIAAKQAELQAWMNEQGIEAISQPTYAYYNDPFTPGFLRRNEVLFDVIKRSNELQRSASS